MVLPIGLIGLGCALLGAAAYLYTKICGHDEGRGSGDASNDNVHEATACR